MPDTASITNELHVNLAVGLSIVRRVWDFRTKDWVTSVFAADVNNDGEAEVIACSRDGRIVLLAAKTKVDSWERVVGDKTNWVCSGTVISGIQPRIMVGKRDGKIYCLDKDGNTITRDGKVLTFDKDGRARDKKAEEEAHWFQANNVVRQVHFDEQSSLLVIGSEDRRVYGLDSHSGELRWTFEADGWVQAMSLCDINQDGVTEVLVGSVDTFLYILNPQGQVLAKHDMKFPVHNIIADNIDQDSKVEILIGTDGKDLAALTYDSAGNFTEKWHIPLNNRILSLCAADIDGDGNKEIIAGLEDKHTYIFDKQGKFIWRHNHKYRINSLFPCDIDKDGLPELLMGSDDNAIRAMRVRPRLGVDDKIRDCYQRLGKPDLSAIEGLSTEESGLLGNILGSRKTEQVTLQQAKEYMRGGHYIRALRTLLKLQDLRVQPYWSRDDVGHIRSVSLRQLKDDPMREIITGTAEGYVQAFKADREPLWSKQIEGRIVEMQTGYFERSKQEEIVVCSSDHHVYILSGTERQELHKGVIETRLSSVCVATFQQQPTQIIIGSEEMKLHMLGSDLKAPAETIDTGRGVGIVRVPASQKAQSLEIVISSLDNHVYAYTRHGERLWVYEAYDHIHSICLKDIDADGNIEVIIGSRDRNVHVLNSAGQLLWRYYLPHSVLSIDAADADLDGNIEIFVGCGDGFLYVFNHEGDYLWKHEAHDRIHAVCVDDINNDGLVEIALGAEDNLELLQVVNPLTIQDLVEQCWHALCQHQPPSQLLHDLLGNSDPVLRAFALRKFSEQASFSAHDFDLLEQFAKDSDLEVRQALVRIALERYQLAPIAASRILQSLQVDPEDDVRSALVENLPTMTRDDWEQSLKYLKHFADSDNRYVRRLAVRALHRLIDWPGEILTDKQREIFDLLLNAALDEKEWVRQEAARTLAYFFDRYHKRLIVDMQRFITKEVQEDVLEHIASAASKPIVKRYLSLVISMLSDLNDENALEKTRQSVMVLERAPYLKFSQDLQLIYGELHSLLTIRTINELAQYQCQLNISQFTQGNQFAAIIMDVFKALSSISRALRIYVRREDLPDQLSSLLDAKAAIERVQKYLEDPYSRQLKGAPVTNLPDHQIFHLLLRRWHRMVDTKLKELSGKAEITAELVAKQTRFEDQVGICWAVSNTGRSSARSVKVSLLHGEDFSVVGRKMSEVETIAPQETIQFEFIIKPRVSTLNLHFAVVYDDAERAEKEDVFEDRLELSETRQEFCTIPNPYTTGAPIRDKKMFFGREADMAYLKDNLSREAKTVVILYGHRRYGKTTLLFQLTNAGTLGEHISVLIDMQEISIRINVQKFLYKMAYAIAQSMKKNHLPVCEPKQADFAINPTHGFIVFLDSIEETLGERKLILLIDEFEVLEEQVAKKRLEPEIFDYLRDIVQHRHNINFLFSGGHQIIEHTRSYRSKFFNIARHYPLSRLSEEGAIALIQQPVLGFLEYEPLTIAKIRQLTNDQPYLIHLLCRAIVDYCNDKRKTFVAINDVNIVLREVMPTIHFHFDWLWEQVSPPERVILSALAKGGKEEGHWLTLDEVIELYQHYRIPFKREELLACLRKLIDFDVIESESNDPRDAMLDSSRFRIPVGLIRRWLLRGEWSLDLVRSQVIESARSQIVQ